MDPDNPVNQTPPPKRALPPFSPTSPLRAHGRIPTRYMPAEMNEITLPPGCSLIVRGVGATQRNSDPVKLVQTAIAHISKVDSNLADVPIIVKPFSTRGDWSTSCYVQLDSPRIPKPPNDTDFSEPRGDLLAQWMNALAVYDPKWSIAWAPAKMGTDKRMYVRFPDLNEASGNQEAGKEKLLQWAKSKNYPVCHSFANPGGIVMSLANPMHVDEVLSKGTHVIKGFPDPLRVLPARQIEIQNVFEMIVMGVPTDYEDIHSMIETWIDNTSAIDEVSTIAGRRIPPNEPETFVFHMVSWADTAKILATDYQEKFTAHFSKYGTSINPPQMLFRVNTDGFYRPKGNLRTDFARGAHTVDKAIKDLQRRFDDMEQKNQQQHQMTQLQLTTITSSLNTVTKTIAGLEDRMVNTQRAILAQSQEVGLSRNLSDMKTNRIMLQTKLLLESDPAQRQIIAGLLEATETETKRLEDTIANASREFLAIVGGPIGQLQLPQTTSTATSPAATTSTSQPGPSAPPGVLPTNLRRTSSTMTGGAEQSEKTNLKKRRTEVSQEDQGMVRRNIPSKPNTLNATHGDTTDSVKNDKLPTKNMFRGVFDTLRDLSGHRRSRTFPRRSCSTNAIPSFIVIAGLLIFASSLIQLAQAVIPPASTSMLSIYALNANGLVKPIKLHHVNSVIKMRNPQVFVIGETKTKSKLSKSLPYSEYDIYEEEGVGAENHHIFKWGIVVGIRKDLQVVQRLQITQQSLKGRVVAIDIILPTPGGKCIPHRIIGCYAPWNPGETDLNKHFWSDLTRLCRSDPKISWTLAGDLNATVAPFERHSGGTEARRQYLQFLHSSNGRDLWADNPDRTRLTDWTCRSKHADGHPTEGNIIDRVATSQSTFIDAEISVTDKYDDWIPYTDHRAIIARITLSDGAPQDELENTMTDFTRKASSPPRVKMPLKTEKHKYETFRETVDTLIEARSLHERVITDDASFLEQYTSLTEIITTTASKVFGHTKPYTMPRKSITNPSIKTIATDLRSIGGAIRYEKSNRTVQVSPKAMKHHEKARLAYLKSREPGADILKILTGNRKALYKTLYAERAKEIVRRAKEADRRQVALALKGSTKKMIQTSTFVPLPFALNDLDNPDKLICDPEGVKATTREYFKRLYDHSRVRELPKPWLDTPSVVRVKRRIEEDRFQWPRETSLSDFRAMLRRGNHRPSPGPDRWEKWTVKSLSDRALSLVLDLHNYEVMNSCFPGNITDLWLTVIHKRGLRTDLKNWRGVAFSNFLANSPMSWLNQCLIRYAAKMSILPDTQVAAQPGVQTRDLMSYLAGVKCWAARNNQTVYAIQRDQMKGFDYLSPNGFYDAIRAYGLPDGIIKLDMAAQDKVRCFIHTAYGATSPITVSGLSKQGGPASPLKSTFTTSMGHYYLRDCLRTDPNALIVSPSNKKRDRPHLVNAEHELLVAMVEATDDTYIFSKSIESLVSHTLKMERFQYAYGWQTQWAKSKAYVLSPEPGKPYPQTITFDSVSIGREVDPLVITQHPLKLIKDDLDFLRTRVDDPTTRYQELKDFVEGFRFPTITGRLPITLIRKIVAQNIISRCRALLSLQPIVPKDAEHLDKLIMQKVHEALGFPFQPATDIAMLPVSKHGLGFPSISRINAGLAIEGLFRDLNHHIPAYRLMALLTRADWTCDKNHCINPLDGPGLLKDHMRRTKSIPANWLIAQKMMSAISLSLRETDQSYIAKGEVSLSHAINLYNHKMSTAPSPTKISGTALRTLDRMNIKNIGDLGKWMFNDNGSITIHAHKLKFDKSWTPPARKNWIAITETLREHLHIEDLLSGPTELAQPKPMRQVWAENYIRSLVNVSGFKPSKASDGRTWASDGSMIPASANVMEDKSITGAATGQKTLVMRIPGRNASILQGEQLGLIIALILSADSNPAQHQQDRLLTDHLNSVRLIDDAKSGLSQAPRLRYMNGRSYYRWILTLAEQSPLDILYTPGHSENDTLEARMNDEADFLASSSQRIFKELPEVPSPTFQMNDFTFHSATDGWIETNIPHYVDLRLAHQTATYLGQRNQRMLIWPHDDTPPPEYPYAKAVSAHSAAVQLYARSGQLATADILRKRNKLEDDKCRVGCDATESPRHLFVNCPKYQQWRDEVSQEVIAKTELKINTIGITGQTKENFIAAAKSLFTDSMIWPLHFSLYYLGQLPNIDNLFHKDPDIGFIQKRRLTSNVAADWHTSSIRLAGRIFGDFQKRMAFLNDNPR